MRSVLTESLSFFEFSVSSCSKFCLRGLLLTAKDFNHEWTRILQFFCYSHLISVLCRTAIGRASCMGRDSLSLVAVSLNQILTNRCLSFTFSVFSFSNFLFF